MAVFLLASFEVVSRKKWLSLYLLSFSFFTFVLFGPSPEYKVDTHSCIGKEFLKAIPEDASVYSQVGLASHLSQRNKLNICLVDYNYNKNKNFSLKDYDYAILDLKGDKFPDVSPAGEMYFARLKELIDEEGMRLVKEKDGFILLKRPVLRGVAPRGSGYMAWRKIFIEEEPVTSPILYAGKEIGLAGVDFPSQSKQGGLFWLELELVKLKEFSGEKEMRIEFRGKRQSFDLEPIVAHGIFDHAYWREGEILRHIETKRFFPFLWPGVYEIFFSLEEEGFKKPAFKIGEVLVKRR